MNQPIAAQASLQSIAVETPEDANFVAYHEVQIKLAQDKRTVYEITVVETEVLRDIADDYTRTSFAAQTLLGRVHGDVYPLELPPIPDIEKNKTKVLDQQLTPYPNPANHSITIPYQIKEESTLNIYNQLGQVVKTTKLSIDQQQVQVNLTDLPTGIYYYHWSTQAAEQGQSSKFVIVR